MLLMQFRFFLFHFLKDATFIKYIKYETSFVLIAEILAILAEYKLRYLAKNK